MVVLVTEKYLFVTAGDRKTLTEKNLKNKFKIQVKMSQVINWLTMILTSFCQ